MKKLLFPLLALMLILAACGNKSDSDSNSDKKEETKSYKLDSGKVSIFLKIQSVLLLWRLHMPVVLNILVVRLWQ